jgi:N-acetylglucosaminyldiphosphoundecaprenol N-acetyl-beta-D-mannosaminyltransferase
MSRVDFMGIPIDALTLEQTVDRILSMIESGHPSQQVSINPAKVVQMVQSSEMRRIVRRCETISVDGMSVVWMARLMGVPLPARVAGIDLMDSLVAAAAERGLKPYFLGAKQDVGEAAIGKYMERHPHLQVAGYRNGYFRSDEEQRIAEEIRDSGAHMLFVAIPSPKKEQFLGKWRDLMGVPYCMGVGGSLDVKSGKLTRAPLWMQKNGLEWVHRLQQEPRKMLKRNAKDPPRFLLLAGISMLTGLVVPE